MSVASLEVTTNSYSNTCSVSYNSHAAGSYIQATSGAVIRLLITPGKAHWHSRQHILLLRPHYTRY